uniref:Phosphatidic acid phosphatase type 2/haloperoxidase domain-containing protein n=1 Tax=viral metagenome TaxID=1070528 RepID=A0A6C0AVP2_9ZZZZ|tara:strand:- start:11413 stop:11955 length:543 start_codon:yes stop_codon:yes gene_type:complete
MYKHIKTYIFLLVVYLVGLPSYYSYLPTIPVYSNDESKIVKKMAQDRNSVDVNFFHLTNESVSHAYVEHVNESIEELNNMFKPIIYVTLFFKFLINRPRPYQIDNSIKYFHTNTGQSPSMPAGHAFHAYYLTKKLSKKYPEKKELFEEIAKKCDDCRVHAGIHYPSDGKMSKQIVDLIYI